MLLAPCTAVFTSAHHDHVRAVVTGAWPGLAWYAGIYWEHDRCAVHSDH